MSNALAEAGARADGTVEAMGEAAGTVVVRIAVAAAGR
jgi:hypothetical protein